MGPICRIMTWSYILEGNLIQNWQKQGKNVCKTSAVQCFNALACVYCCFLARRAKWLPQEKRKELHRSVVISGGTTLKISFRRVLGTMPVLQVSIFLQRLATKVIYDALSSFLQYKIMGFAN